MNQKLIKKFSLAAVGLILLGAGTETWSLDSAPVQAASQKEVTRKVSFHVYKHHSKKTSMAQGFIGKEAQVVIKNGKVTSLTIHVDGRQNKMGQSKDVSSIVKSLAINHKSGQKRNIAADGSNFDYVFPGSAFKAGKKLNLKVTIDLGMKMTETADIKFGKVSGLKNDHKHPKKIAKKRHSKKSKKSTKRRVSKRKIRKHHRR